MSLIEEQGSLNFLFILSNIVPLVCWKDFQTFFNKNVISEPKDNFPPGYHRKRNLQTNNRYRKADIYFYVSTSSLRCPSSYKQAACVKSFYVQSQQVCEEF